MKQYRSWWTVVPLSALVLSGCNEKKVEEVKETVKEKVETAVAKVTGEEAPKVKALTAGERAAFLGIVGRLSKDTQSVFSVLDGNEIAKRMKSLKTWGFITETAKAEAEVDLEAEITPGAEQASKFLGQEFFIATGKGTDAQMANAVKINEITTYYQMRAMAKAFAGAAATGKLDDPEALMGGDQWVQDLLKDLGKQLGLVDNMQVPPVLVGVKAADKESVGMLVQQIVSSMDMLSSVGPAAAPLNFTKGGVDFKGYNVSGTMVAEILEQGRAEMEEASDPADVEKLIESVKKKNIAIAAGSFENYVFLYLGDSEESCPLVSDVNESLAASDTLSFVDGYAAKKVVGFLYGSEGLAKSVIGSSLKPIADGVRDGLASAEGFGDSRDIAALLDTVGEKESALLAMAKPSTTGGLAVLEDGVKFELYGQTDTGMLDHGVDHKIGKLPEDDNTLLTASWTGNATYNKHANELGEALIETAYALTSKFATFDVPDSEEFAQFKGGFAMFDQSFRTDVVGLWNGVQAAKSGLGEETALVIDMKGKLPPLPSVPQELVDEGRSARISVISPVTDRSKLTTAWTTIDASAKNIMKTVSGMVGSEIPMPQPTSSEKNGLVTWFFPMPFFNDDLMPSVSVSDKWFVASTSKNQAVDLVAAADGEKSDRKGAWMEINLDALRKFGSDWVGLVDKYGDKLITDAGSLSEFRAQLPTIRKGLEAAQEWDQISVHEREENGKLRSTLHFKVR